MYTYLGIHNLPNGVITWIQMDAADGDSCLDDLVDKGIPVYERGISSETVLAGRYGGESQKYFNTDLGGRFVDQYADDIAHESKGGYTCLSQ